MRKPLPRFVIAKTLKSGATGFYFNIPTLYRRLGCKIPNEPLGDDYSIACGTDGNGGRAVALNELFNEWNHNRLGQSVREQVYVFAWGCIERGRPESAAAAVICFEWLQRRKMCWPATSDGQTIAARNGPTPSV
jgi:hypothetical protein